MAYFQIRHKLVYMCFLAKCWTKDIRWWMAHLSACKWCYNRLIVDVMSLLKSAISFFHYIVRFAVHCTCISSWRNRRKKRPPKTPLSIKLQCWVVKRESRLARISKEFFSVDHESTEAVLKERIQDATKWVTFHLYFKRTHLVIAKEGRSGQGQVGSGDDRGEPKFTCTMAPSPSPPP